MYHLLLNLLPLAVTTGGISIDTATLIAGVVVGAAAGVGASYFFFYNNKPGEKKVSVVQRDPGTGQMTRKSVTVDELELSKREMRTLVLERDLLSAALTKIYEAETDGKITKEEREIIARRYSNQIREMEAKLRDTELVVEVGELEKLRDELVSLFREKIQNIETRLEQAKERLPPLREEAPPPVRPETTSNRQVRPANLEVTPNDDLEKVVVQRKASSARKEETEGEKRVNALRDEVLDMIAQLEQIETKKAEETETN